MAESIRVLAKRLSLEDNDIIVKLGELGVKNASLDDEVSEDVALKLAELALGFGSAPAAKTNKLSVPTSPGAKLKVPPSTGGGLRAPSGVRARTKGRRTAATALLKPTGGSSQDTAKPGVEAKRAQTDDIKFRVQAKREREQIESERRIKEAEAQIAKERASKELQAKREAEAKKAQEEQRRAEETARKLAEEEQRRKEEERKTREEQKLRKQEEQRKQRESLARSRNKPYQSKNKRKVNRGVLDRPDSFGGTGTEAKPDTPRVYEVELGESIVVSDLAKAMSVKTAELITKLLMQGVVVTTNDALDRDTAELLVEEFGHTVKHVEEETVEDKLLAQVKNVGGEQVPRAPVVTVMGHVDHGKTSLLDHIRKTRVAAGEAGGITQHIGAYRLETDHGPITFLDTPGHAAFSAMRARGANATDIVVLVCAANDGVMPQTEESVNHCKNAGVPMVVAVNKIDLPSANPEQVKNGLNALGVAPEEWGGDTQFIEVSAETGQGIDGLLEALSLQAELLELQEVAEGPAQGVIIESKIERGRGPVATLLVQRGQLKNGDVVIAGECHGRVRSLIDDQNKKVKTAGPSTAVELLGLNGSPAAGDLFLVADNERQARQIAEQRAAENQARQHRTMRKTQLDNVMASLGQGEKSILKILLKCDVRGSLEAISQAAVKIGNDEVSLQILGSGVGGINESDINMALTYDAIVIGFNVRADKSAKDLMKRSNLEARYYNVIYELLEDLEKMLTDMLVPESREEIVGIAEVRQVYRSPRFGQIAGCMVTEGSVFRNKKIRVLRDNTVIFEGELESLRRFKDDVNDVGNGFECGIGVRDYKDVKEGDLIEVYETLEVARTL